MCDSICDYELAHVVPDIIYLKYQLVESADPLSRYHQPAQVSSSALKNNADFPIACLER
jgi:hypothetical protein